MFTPSLVLYQHTDGRNAVVASPDLAASFTTEDPGWHRAGPIDLVALLPELAAGERYAGLVLDDTGKPTHHLILLPGDVEMTWQAATEWAASIGGELPTRAEQALLFANTKGQFKRDWYWSAESHEKDGSFAWGQDFGDGLQSYDRKSYEGRARAVRRFAA